MLLLGRNFCLESDGYKFKPWSESTSVYTVFHKKLYPYIFVYKNKPLIAKLWNLAGKKICDVPVFIVQEINIPLNILCTRWRLITSYVKCCHRARDTVQLLTRETPDFIPPSLWPPNSQDLNLVDYRVWGVLQERVYRQNIRTCGSASLRSGSAWTSSSSTTLSSSGVSVSVLVFLQTADILNICCKIPMLNSWQ